MFFKVAEVSAEQTLKPTVLLSPMAWEGQTLNNCGPMSAKMVLSYYGINLSQESCRLALRPNGTDKMTRVDQLVSFIESKGLKAALRENGNLNTLRELLSLGVPVITMQWLKQGNPVAHYRVARGYNLANNTFIFADSMYSSQVIYTAAQVESLWKSFDHRYIAVYRAEQEEAVKTILGEDADAQTNLIRAVDAAFEYANVFPGDIDAWRNLGYTVAARDNCAWAISIWEQNLRPMIARNAMHSYFLWYELWPLQCYNKVGHYNAVLATAPGVLAATGVYAELRYEYAVALLNVGRTGEAIAQLKRSLLDDLNHEPSRQLLNQLGV
jgi:tetratricopeptide (TPR) repeat protein